MKSPMFRTGEKHRNVCFVLYQSLLEPTGPPSIPWFEVTCPSLIQIPMKAVKLDIQLQVIKEKSLFDSSTTRDNSCPHTTYQFYVFVRKIVGSRVVLRLLCEVSPLF